MIRRNRCGLAQTTLLAAVVWMASSTQTAAIHAADSWWGEVEWLLPGEVFLCHVGPCSTSTQECCFTGQGISSDGEEGS